MKPLKKLCRLKAGSLLESVIALTIIAICLYVATMVYAAVFTSQTSLRHYEEQGSVSELFYLYQLKRDSIDGGDSNGKWKVLPEAQKGGEKITINYKDSAATVSHEKIFYLHGK